MSAEQLVETIIQNAMSVADSKSSQADKYASSAVTSVGGRGSYVRHRSVPPASVTLQRVAIPSIASGVSLGIYNSTQQQIISDLTSRFADFFGEYFPNYCDSLQKAQDWICRALTEGGTGIKPHVEDQVWQRQRSRVLREAARASAEVINSFAARGFPLPPGPAVHQMGLVQQTAMNAIADSGREQAIQQLQLEIENVRFAVTNAINLRMQAMQATADYIRSIALGPQIASQMATASGDAQAKLIGAVASYNGAFVRVGEMQQDASKATATLTVEAEKANLSAFIDTARVKGSTVAAVAASMGSQAAAALNAIHTSASVAVHGEASE